MPVKLQLHSQYISMTLKNKIKLVLLIAFNIVILIVVVHALTIYTSLIPGLPWFDPCGMQFIVLWFLHFRAFLFIGVISIFFGRFFGMSLLPRFLPFMTGVGILVIFPDQTLPFYLLALGTIN